jgi:transposase
MKVSNPSPKKARAELAEVGADIDSGVRSSPAWREKEGLLTSVPGVGPVTARTGEARRPRVSPQSAVF